MNSKLFIAIWYWPWVWNHAQSYQDQRRIQRNALQPSPPGTLIHRAGVESSRNGLLDINLLDDFIFEVTAVTAKFCQRKRSAIHKKRKIYSWWIWWIFFDGSCDARSLFHPIMRKGLTVRKTEKIIVASDATTCSSFSTTWQPTSAIGVWLSGCTVCVPVHVTGLFRLTNLESSSLHSHRGFWIWLTNEFSLLKDYISGSTPRCWVYSPFKNQEYRQNEIKALKLNRIMSYYFH